MAERGRPTKYLPEHCETVLRLSENGKCIAEICSVIGIGRDSWHEWRLKHSDFSDAVKKGQELRERWWANVGIAAMAGEATINGKPVKINSTMFIWLSKNIVGWRDKIDVKEQDDDEYEFRTK